MLTLFSNLVHRIAVQKWYENEKTLQEHSRGVS